MSLTKREWSLVVAGAVFGVVATTIHHKRRLSSSKTVQTQQLSPRTSATDPQDFISAGIQLLQWIVNYRTSASTFPVISQVEPNYLRNLIAWEAPEKAEEWAEIIRDLDRVIVPGLTHWESDKFFAYFKPHSSYPAVLGELVCAGMNVMGFDWIASPACTELEVCVLDWLAKILNLPPKFLNHSEGPGGSVIQGSSGEAAIVVILAAIVRAQKSAAKTGRQLSRDQLVVYGSNQTHAIIQKACMILGIPNYHQIPTNSQTAFALTPTALAAAIERDVAQNLVPLLVVVTCGTTSSCAFDDVTGLSQVAKQHGVWVHVDAAYGGAYACLPELSELFVGLDQTDSFCVNCHKKLLCPFDLAALYVADRRPILDALSLQPEYLKNAASESGAVVDYEHWQLPLGRRFRALKLWFVLRRFGAEGIREHVRNGVRLSSLVKGFVENDEMFEIAAPVQLSLVCFRLKGRPESDQEMLLKRVKASGDCFVIHTKLEGKIVIRFACGGIEQNEECVTRAWAVIKREAQVVVNGV